MVKDEKEKKKLPYKREKREGRASKRKCAVHFKRGRNRKEKIRGVERKINGIRKSW